MPMRRTAAAGLFALAVAAQLSATATVGPVRRVSDGEARCENHPAVAPLRSGGFAVAWDRYAGDDAGVLLRLAGAQGRLSGPARLFRGRLLGVLLDAPAGDLVAIWTALAGSGTWMQRLSPSGEPLEPEVPLPIDAAAHHLAAAMAADGRIAVVWPSGEDVKGRWFSASGLPLGPEIDIGRSQVELSSRRVAAAVDSAGRLAAAWLHQEQPGPGMAIAARFRRFDAEGHAAGPAVGVSADVLGPAAEQHVALAAMPDGGLAVAWERNELPGSNHPSVWFRRFDAADHPVEDPVAAAPGNRVSASPAFASDGGGRLALSWFGPETGAVRLLGAPGPPGPELPLHIEYAESYDIYLSPAVAFLANGRLAVAWANYHYTGTFPTPCDYTGIFERVVDLAPAVRPPQAAGAEVLLSGPAPQEGRRPRIAVAPGGGWMAVWEADCNVLRGRAFDAAGNPRAPEVELGRGPCADRPLSAALTGLPNGGFVAAWTDDGPDGLIRMLRLGPDGQPAGPELAAGSPGSRHPQLAPQLVPGTGGFLLAWSEPPSGAIRVQPFRGDGSPLAAPVPVAEGAAEDPFDLAALPGGRFVAAWNGSETQVLARLLDPSGTPSGPALPVSTEDLKQGRPHAAPSGDGFAVAWTAEDASARLRRFGPDGRPRGDEIEADTLREHEYYGDAALRVEDLAASREGVLWLLVTKAKGFPYEAVELTGVAVVDGEPLGPPVLIGSGKDVAGAGAAADGCGWIAGWSLRAGKTFETRARRFAGGCPDRPGVLRLGGGRFLAEADWRTQDGGSGTGQARTLADDTGAFWFFWPENLELIVKVLDGRGLNGAFWVFYATLTDVAFDLRITDLETGLTKVYSKPAGRLESRADVEAFP